MFHSDNVTLRDGILKQRNSLNFIRLCLAIFVILGHSYPLAYGSHGRLEFLGGLAVNLFFCISGFLILASAQNVNIFSYIWRRFLRIFPGFWVSLIFVSFVAYPISYFLGFSSGALNLNSSFEFIINNFLLKMNQFDISGGPVGVPFDKAWNGSLWTLWYEFIAYLCIIPLAYIPIIKDWQRWTFTIAFVVSLGMYPLLEMVNTSTNMYYNFARLVPMFLAGSVLYVWGDKIRVSLIPSLISLTIILLVSALDMFSDALHVSQIFFAYGILSLACIIKIYIGYRNDLSYGVYIYAFPVQQLVVMVGIPVLGMVTNNIIVLSATLVLAYLSWTFVEKPAMSLKNKI
ncbi:acyltransferase family protein [Rothia sp. P6271]|uniref:acyltransferase family protein n=1 Tax=Rothia sp. P6271 TaxID=3402659 RepID=UPI003ABF6F70